jgi:hypothetical protein
MTIMNKANLDSSSRRKARGKIALKRWGKNSWAE